jgi:hypothetical protein
MREPLGVEILDVVTAKALADEDYKDELLADPVKVLTDEGLMIPDKVDVKIVQNTGDKIYLVLPSQMPQTIDFGEVNILIIACHTGGV